MTGAVTLTPTRRDRAIAIAAIVLLSLVLIALARRFALGAVGPLPGERDVWLALHLASTVPAVPIGAWVLARRKGDALHRVLGRTWAVLMLVAAGSSFGLGSLTGGLGPIHMLSVLTLVGVPRAVWQARSGNVAGHRRTMTIVYASLVIAGFFTFLPSRLLGSWLMG